MADHGRDHGSAPPPSLACLLVEIVPEERVSQALGALPEADSLADHMADHPVELEVHPVPHPGCLRCDPAFMRSRLAHAGFRRRVRAENRGRWVLVDGGGMLFVPERGAP